MAKNNGRAVLAAICASLLIILVKAPLAAQEIYFNCIERQLTIDTADQFDPSISGDWVVYSDRRNADADIYLYDLAADSEIQVTSGGGDQLLNDVYLGLVVYTDYGSGQADIYLYTTSGATIQITKAIQNQRRPAIYDESIVYENDIDGNYDIYYNNLAGTAEVQATSDLSHQRKCDVFKRWIVYEDYRLGSGADIGLYDRMTSFDTVFGQSSAQEVDPCIDNDIVAYGSNQYSLGDIMYYRISTGDIVQVTEGTAYERNPSISGDFIAYESYVSGDADIWVYSLSLDTSFQVTIDAAEQYLHDISGNRIVYTDNRNDNLDIYLSEFEFYLVYCGDANGDGGINVGDAVFLIAYVFKGGLAPVPLCTGDANGDGEINVGDAVYLIAYVFKGGPAPVEPCCQ